MKTDYKKEIKIELEKSLNRSIKENEDANLENDSLLLSRFLMRKVEELQERVSDLERFLVK